MEKTWGNDSCVAMKAHYAVYSIRQAAALWCGVPDSEVSRIVKEATQLSPSGVGRSIWVHPDIPCLEPRSRAIAEAIEDGVLPHGREDGATVPAGTYAAYERRHFFGRDLKKWMEKAFPNEKPAFLFDDIERNTHTAISADSFRALQADRDALRNRIEKATEVYKALKKEKEDIEAERNSLKSMVDKAGEPGERAEITYQNIIAALLDCIGGNLPNIKKHPSFSSEAKLIEFIDEHYRGYNGLSKSNLSRKFPEAKKSLQSQ
jgi:hypothetical protein